VAYYAVCSLCRWLRASCASSVKLLTTGLIVTSIQRRQQLLADQTSRLSLEELEDRKEAQKAISGALERLHFVAIAIRKTSAKRLAYDVNTYLLDEDRHFHQHAVSYVKWKFRAASRALCTQLGDSIAVRRRMLLDKRSHGINLTTRRTTHRGDVLQKGAKAEIQGAFLTTQATTVGQIVPSPGQGPSASRPAGQSVVLRHLTQPLRPILASERCASSSPSVFSFEYPEPPRCEGGDQYVSCPYCFMGLNSANLRAGGSASWRLV
jgi:hypothetical protein